MTSSHLCICGVSLLANGVMICIGVAPSSLVVGGGLHKMVSLCDISGSRDVHV